MSKAKLVLHTRYIDEQGELVEMKAMTRRRRLMRHSGGKRLVGYDNHERKGDHRHYRSDTTPYVFTTVDRLIEDFLRDVGRIREEWEP